MHSIAEIVLYLGLLAGTADANAPVACDDVTARGAVEIDAHSRDLEQLNQHGHSHALPGQNMSSMVWMVVMGDGFHNFCDGVAIGTQLYK